MQHLLPETPPRAWGRLFAGNTTGSTMGNTPTCVGKTVSSRNFLDYPGKHPHVRGEDHAGKHSFEDHRETPPRAWGRPILLSDAAGKIRNTPTCVGKTLFCNMG